MGRWRKGGVRPVGTQAREWELGGGEEGEGGRGGEGERGRGGEGEGGRGGEGEGGRGGIWETGETFPTFQEVTPIGADHKGGGRGGPSSVLQAGQPIGGHFWSFCGGS